MYFIHLESTGAHTYLCWWLIYKPQILYLIEVIKLSTPSTIILCTTMYCMGRNGPHEISPHFRCWYAYILRMYNIDFVNLYLFTNPVTYYTYKYTVLHSYIIGNNHEGISYCLTETYQLESWGIPTSVGKF